MSDQTSQAVVSVDDTRKRLAQFLALAFVIQLVALLFIKLPVENKDVVTYMVGQLSGMVTTAIAYYFTKSAGQDALDAKRADNTGKALDAANANSPKPDVVLAPGETAQAATAGQAPAGGVTTTPDPADGGQETRS